MELVSLETNTSAFDALLAHLPKAVPPSVGISETSKCIERARKGSPGCSGYQAPQCCCCCLYSSPYPSL